MASHEDTDARTLDTLIESLKPDTPNMIAGVAGAGIAIGTVIGIYTPNSLGEAFGTYGTHMLSSGMGIGAASYVLASIYQKD